MLHVPEGRLWDLDRALMLGVNGSWGAGWDGFWWLVTQPWFWAPLFVATIWLLWRRLGVRGMLLALGIIILGLALADQTANFFKTFTPKFRPSRTLLPWGEAEVAYNSLIHTVKSLFTGENYIGGNFGTVSGHAATASAIGITAAGIIRRWWFTSAMVVYIVLTAFSRIYLGVHFPLDILFGLTAGTLIACAMIALWNKFGKGLKLPPPHSKKMKPNIIPTILAALTLASCGESTSTDGIRTLDLAAAIDNPRTFDLGEIAETIDFIPLDDSQNDGLVGDIIRLEESKNRLFVMDSGRENPVKIFDRAGHFLTTEGRYGRGPGEYTNISSIAADHDTDNLYMSVISGINPSLVVYDSYGRELARNDSVMASNMVIHNGNLLLLRTSMIRIGDEQTPGTMIPFLDSYSLPGLELETAIEAPDRGLSMVIRTVEQGITVTAGPSAVLASDGSTVWTKEALSDTLKRYRNGALEPAFVLDPGGYAIPDGALGMDPTTDMGNGYAIQGILGNDRYLFVQAYGFRDNVRARLVFDLEDPSSTPFSATRADGWTGFFIDGVQFRPMYIRAGRLVGWMQALDIVDAAEKGTTFTNPDLAALATTIKEDSNPVIVVAELK